MGLNLRPKEPRCRWVRYHIEPCSSPGKNKHWIPCYACQVSSLLQISLCFVVCSTLNTWIWLGLFIN
ncbi:hypothetical protein Peur_055267 [Populus x canadensis]